jgi:hypothetical protein
MTRFLLLSDSCGFLDVRRSLWREDGSVVNNCCWHSPEQSFSGPSPVRLVTIFCCLRFETSLSDASCDWQGYGGGIRPRLQTGESRSSQHASLYSLAHIHGNCLLIPLTWKARSVPSRFPRIRISIERVLASRCLAMDCSSFQASCLCWLSSCRGSA